MTQILSDDLNVLRAAVSGPVIAPDDRGYDDARKLWNADIDRRPAAIVRCASPTDVSATIGYATRNGLELAVRGGAHSFAGLSSVDGGVVIDLSLLNEVSVNPAARRARVGGGALLGDVDRATQAHGLAVPMGMVGHTGVGGLSLGGGIGWLAGKAGLSIDNLVSAEIVTADGRIRRIDEQHEPDLFWAIRGGGGNFGVVTEFEFRLHEVGPMIQFGFQFWGLDQGAAVLRLADRVVSTLSDDITLLVASLNAPPAPFVPQQHQLQPGYALIFVGLGAAEEHANVLAGIRAELPPLFEFATPMPFVALQEMLDEGNRWGLHDYEKGTYLEKLTDESIAVITEFVPRKTSPLTVVLFQRLDGAYSRVGENETAYSGERSDRFAVFIIAECPAPEMLPQERAWVRDFWTALSAHAGIGAYINSVSDAEADRVRASYGTAKYERLARIKRAYDPDNVFHRNANIQPAP